MTARSTYTTRVDHPRTASDDQYRARVWTFGIIPFLAVFWTVLIWSVVR